MLFTLYLLNLFLPFYRIKNQSYLIEVEALEVKDELDYLFVVEIYFLE
jgi:hypothetical protein